MIISGKEQNYLQITDNLFSIVRKTHPKATLGNNQMMEKQQPEHQKQNENGMPLPNQEELTSQISNVQSNTTQLYFDCFGLKGSPQTQLALVTQKLFEIEKIRYTPHFEEETLKIQVFQSNPNHRFVALKASLGPFSFIVYVFVQQRVSPSHNFASKSNCRDTTVFLTPNKEAVKCFSFLEGGPAEAFAKALKEFCFLKIASGLGVGPRLGSSIGFDLLISQNCVEFAMEQCLPAEACPSGVGGKGAEDLWRQLLELHALQIVHMDIKPSNIMFSPSRGHLVFTDFGFSRLLKESVGLKSLTRFFGTLNYCSAQMQHAFSSKQSAEYVDLYYNDAHCLRRSIQQFLRSKDILDNEQENNNLYQDGDIQELICYLNGSSIFYKQHCEILRTMFLMYTLQFDLLKRKYQIGFMVKHADIFLGIIEECYYHRELDYIQITLLSKFTQGSEPEQKNMRANMQAKRSKIFINTPEQNVTNIFLDKLLIDELQNTVLIVDDMKIVIHVKDDDKDQMIDKEELKQLPRGLCFRKFLKTVDLRAALSTFPEKEIMAKILLSVFPGDGTIKARTQYVWLERSLRSVLEEELREPSEYFDFTIPCAITNLVILDALSLLELTDAFQKVVKVRGYFFRIVILLFRSHLIMDWIFFKAVSEFQDIKFEAILLKILQQRMIELTKSSEFNQFKQFLFILQKLRLSRLNQEKLGEKFRHFAINYLKQMKELDEEFIEEIISHIIYETQKKAGKEFDIHELNVLISLAEYFPKILTNRRRISHVHLKIFNLLKLAGQEYLGAYSFIYQTLTNCLQDFNLIITFKIFYSYQNIAHFKRINEEKVDFFIQICQDKKYLNCADTLAIFYQILIQCWPNEDTSDRIKNRLKTIFTKAYLQTMRFPENNFLNSIDTFFDKVNFIIFIYKILYQKDSEESALITTLFEQLQNYWNEIVCQECKCACCKNLLEVKVMNNLMDGKLIESLEFCLDKIQTLSTVLSWKVMVSQNLITMFIKYIFKILYQEKANFFEEMKPYRKQGYDLVCRLKLYHLVFRDQKIEMFYIINSYLIDQLNDTEVFIKFHQEALKVIFTYPCKEFIRVYDLWLGHFLSRRKEIMATKAEKIIVNCLSSQSWNAYSCLLLVHLIKIVDSSSKLFEKSVLSICRNANVIITKARNISMHHLFTYLLLETSLVAGRERKRKIIKHFKYLKPLFSLPTFQKNMRNKKTIEKYNILFRNKLQRLYQNNFPPPTVQKQQFL